MNLKFTIPRKKVRKSFGGFGIMPTFAAVIEKRKGYDIQNGM